MMDPNAALVYAQAALNDGDLVTAKMHLTDISNWISIGGFTPSGYYDVLDMYNELERAIMDEIDELIK